MTHLKCETLYERYGELKARVDNVLGRLEEGSREGWAADFANQTYVDDVALLSHVSKDLRSFQQRVAEVYGNDS